jgi:hypothetical protein
VADHAHTFSASIFERLMLCPGSAVLSQDAVRTTSAYAEWGTQCHELAAKILMGEPYNCFDSEMLEVAQQYVDYVQALAGDNVWVEQRVSFAEPLGIPADADDGFGTADAIVAKGSELIVIDLKTGRGVDVDATDNPQLKCYALGALELLNGLAGDFDTVRLVIHQPRAGGVKEWVTSVADLYAWAGSEGKLAVDLVRSALAFDDGPTDEFQGLFLNEGEKQCKFCPAKATCPALRNSVATTIGASEPASPDEFLDDIQPTGTGPYEAADWLAACLSKVDLIEDWCKAVRAEAERRLMAGDEVPGFKVVQGKKGNRKWVDAAAVETLFKETFRLKVEEMYDLSLISPTSADKLAKAKIIGPRQWAKVTGLITQSEGKPHVAPASDPRPALDVKPVRDDFADLADDIA